jgi:hypothetical protein
MKYLKVAGLCLVSMLAMGMALAGNAAAALLWLLCLEGSGLTKYSSNQCTEASSTGKWQSLGLPSGGSDTVRLLAFTLLLIDNGASTVRCDDAGKGWGLIENGKLIIKVAEVPNPVAEGCEVEKNFLTCETNKLTKISGVNLPWTSEMFETEGKNLANIKAPTGKKPGWAVTCGGVTDTCEEETPEFSELQNGVTKGVLLVLARFENKGIAKCSIGGTGKGEVKGLIAVLLWNGNGLSLTTL